MLLSSVRVRTQGYHNFIYPEKELDHQDGMDMDHPVQSLHCFGSKNIKLEIFWDDRFEEYFQPEVAASMKVERRRVFIRSLINRQRGLKDVVDLGTPPEWPKKSKGTRGITVLAKSGRWRCLWGPRLGGLSPPSVDLSALRVMEFDDGHGYLFHLMSVGHDLDL